MKLQLSTTIFFAWMFFLAPIGNAQDWISQNTGINEQVFCVDAADENIVWAGAQNGVFLHTTNGGLNWTSSAIPNSSNLALVSVEAVDANTAYYAATNFSGGDTRIYKTTDAGTSWQLQYQNTSPESFFNSIAFWDDLHGIAVGDPVNGSFLIVTTTDGGNTWVETLAANIPPPLPGEFAGFGDAGGTVLAVEGTDNAWFGTGYASPGGTIRVFRSTDGGQNWAAANTPLTTTGQFYGITTTAFVDSLTGFAGGGESQSTTNTLAKTTDGGLTWNIVSTFPAAFPATLVIVPGTGNSTLAVTLGANSSGFSTDTGNTWVTFGSEFLVGLTFASPNAGWATGLPPGSIYRFTGQLSSTLKRVPQDYPTIQAGIDAAADGDTVLVADSTYFENINFRGKAITVASNFILDGDTNHIANTVIDGSQPANPDSGSVVYFVSNEGTNSVLTGFTITGGKGTQFQGTEKGGGGVFSYFSEPRISYNRIENNSVVNTSTGNAFGGGVYTGPVGSNTTIIIEDNIIRLNRAEAANRIAFGGGICISSNGVIRRNQVNGNVVIYSGTLTGDFTWSFGGGISCINQQTFRFVVITENMIVGNQSISGNLAYSGGVDLIWTNTNFWGNTVSGNKVSGASFGFAGGMRFLLSESSSSVSENLFANNGPLNVSNTVSGGGLLTVATGDLTIASNTFQDNQAVNGGGIYVSEDVNPTVENNRILTNEVSSLGGGIYILDSSPVIKNNLIVGNSAQSGGGIRIFTSSTALHPEAELLEFNSAGMRGAISHKKDTNSSSEPPGRSDLQISASSAPQIENNTLVDNVANSQGGGIYSTNSQAGIINTILWGNTAPSGAQILVNGGDITLEYSDVQGGWSGTGNIDADPLFADTVNYYLSPPFSPAIDTGNPDPQYNDPEDSDNPGTPCLPALGGMRNDMGAYGGPGVICIDSVLVGIDDDLPENVPQAFKLLQNYPNPFNPTTTIAFELPHASRITLHVYDALGRKVATLASGQVPAGRHEMVWNGTNQVGQPVPSGVYFYRLSTFPVEVGVRGVSQTRKMLLIR